MLLPIGVVRGPVCTLYLNLPKFEWLFTYPELVLFADNIVIDSMPFFGERHFGSEILKKRGRTIWLDVENLILHFFGCGIPKFNPTLKTNLGERLWIWLLN